MRSHAERWYRVRALIRKLQRVVIAHGQLDHLRGHGFAQVVPAEDAIEELETQVGAEIDQVTSELVIEETKARIRRDNHRRKKLSAKGQHRPDERVRRGKQSRG